MMMPPRSPSWAPPPRRGIYIASRSRHAARWRTLRDHAGLPILSTWIDRVAGVGHDEWNDLWQCCLEEASLAHTLILFAEDGDILRGALLEVGAALALGRRVIYVGPDSVLADVVRFSRRIERADSLEEAFAMAVEGLPPLP